MFKKRKQQREITRVQKRIQTLPSGEIVGWVNNSIYNIDRNLSMWSRTEDATFLEEARLASEVLHEALESLSRRVNA
jgi:hypothetical protein